LDLKGNLVFLWSKKNATEQEVINEILKHGQPLIFATDKRKIPSFIQKLSDRFLVDVFSPKKDLSISLKKQLVREFGIKLKSPHELDALASALYYYKLNKNKLNYLINKFGEKAVDLIKYGYVREVKEKKDEFREPIKINAISQFTEKDEVILDLKKSLLIKDFYIRKLKSYIAKLKEKIKNLSLKLKACKKEESEKWTKKIKELEKENKELREKVTEIEELLECLNKGECVLLWDWKLKYFTKYSFIDEEEFEEVNKNTLEKFRRLVVSSKLSWYKRFGNIIIAKKKEVEKALEPSEEETKKIIEYFKIYRTRRKNLLSR